MHLASHSPVLPASAVALLSGVVDYAGLFPPAALTMEAAAAEYAAALAGADAWMLGHFVVPVSRVPELANVLDRATTITRPWRLSAIATEGSDAELATVRAWNASQTATRAVIDTVECRPAQLAGIEKLASTARDLDVYVEVAPSRPDVAEWLQRVATHGLRAKLRTGGVTADAFPSPGHVVAFLAAAMHAGVRCKVTAGLHHAVRGEYRLTYDSDAREAPMYGYLNVLLATAALHAGASHAEAEGLLLCTESTTLAFTDDEIRWGKRTFPLALLAETRAHLANFGSCSFREPVAELRALALGTPDRDG